MDMVVDKDPELEAVLLQQARSGASGVAVRRVLHSCPRLCKISSRPLITR